MRRFAWYILCVVIAVLSSRIIWGGRWNVACQSRDSRRSIGRIPLVSLVVVLAGCMTMSPQSSTTAWRTIDSPAPLGAAEDYAARRPVPPATSRKKTPRPTADGALTLPKTGESADDEVDLDGPPEIVRAVPDLKKDTSPKIGSGPSLESIPKIEPDEVTVGRPLELTVTAPARKAPGGTVTYRVTLRNTGDRPLEGLAVHCQFDDALVFSGSDRREVVRRIERLPAGESKEMALSLTSDKTGSHCCWFMVTRDDAGTDVEMVSRQVCVEFVTRHVEIDVVGPTQRTEGSRAEFNISLANNSLKTINDTQVVVAYDKALLPREASAEAEKKSGTLVWNLGVLHPLEKVQLQVEFECQMQAHRACVFVDVKGTNLNGEREEACLEIVPVPGTLDLRVSDRDDPLETGRTGVYEATVQNIGLQPARGVALEATIPENVRFVSAAVRVGDKLLSLKYAADGNKVVFDAVDQLAPNARLTYTFEVEALRPGLAEFRASLTSALGSTAVTATEPTSILVP
jgi:uncharacterized repeat protein (TIGR01451 family)